jgi:hypothetical protein
MRPQGRDQNRMKKRRMLFVFLQRKKLYVSYVSRSGVPCTKLMPDSSRLFGRSQTRLKLKQMTHLQRGSTKKLLSYMIELYKRVQNISDMKEPY